MKRQDLGALLLLAALWGASFLFIRVAVPVLGPPTLVVGRVLLAVVVLLGYAAVRGQRMALQERWRPYLVLGLVNAALPFLLVAAAELAITASLAAILNATTPLWGALAAARWLSEPLTGRKLGGLAMGLVGVMVVVGWAPLELNGPALLGVAAMLLAAVCYGLGGVYTRIGFGGVAPLELAVGQQLVAGLVLLPVAVAAPPAGWPTPTALGALLALAILSTALGYLLYFRLMARVGPTATLSVTFLIPAFGILWGALVLGEQISAGQLAGLAIVLLGLRLVTTRPASSPAMPRVAR